MSYGEQAHEAWADFLKGYAQNPYWFTAGDYFKRMYGVQHPQKVMSKILGSYMAPLASQYQLTREDMLNQMRRANLGFGAQQRALAQLGRESALAGTQAGAAMRQAATQEYLAQQEAELRRKLAQLQTVYNATAQKTAIDMARAGMSMQLQAAEQQGYGDLFAGGLELGGMFGMGALMGLF